MRNMKLIFVLIFSTLFFTGCSEEWWEELSLILQKGFSNYSAQNPLTVFSIPFKPADEFDPESAIGKIAWDGTAEALENLEWWSDGLIKYTGFERNNTAAYISVLQTDTFWKDMYSNKGQIRNVLSRKCSEVRSKAIIYGLYEGGDLNLNLTSYMYVKPDDIIQKERTTIKARVDELRSLRLNLKNGSRLTGAQKALAKNIQEKSKVTTTRLVRKYLEGK